MTLAHPLDRPVWSALTSRQAPLSLGDTQALRFDPAYGLFAAAADASPESTAALGALITSPNGMGLVEAGDMPLPPGAVVRAQAACVQMVAASLNAGGKSVAFEPLGEADAAGMLALATLTVPGPFFEKTHRLGDFIGIKIDGRLIAMAGERMKPDGYTEVSGVCTHPDFRGQGYAGEGSRALIDHGFTALGVQRVVAETMVVHTASRRVMEKCGMRLVRTFHADWPVRIPGDEHGDVEYAITREEWDAARSST